MFNDPSGRVIQVIYIIAAVVGIIYGYIAANATYADAKKNGLSDSDALWTAIFTGVTTAIATAVSIINPVLGPAAVGIASFLNNGFNQLVSNGWNFDNVDEGRAFTSGLIAAGSAWLFDWALGKGPYGVKNELVRSLFSTPISQIYGMCFDSGFGEPNVTCNLSAGEPQQSTPDGSRPRNQ